jgi:PAS domain S-box-containing protein
MALSPAQEPSHGAAAQQGVGAALIASIACAVAAWVAARIAVAPDYATPIQAATGIALAAVLVYGRRILPVIGAGAVAAQGVTLLERGLPPSTAWALAATFGAIAVLQAGLGAALVRRLVPGPLTLSEPGDVGRFYAGGALACVLGAALTAVVAHALGGVGGPASGLTALTAFIGDLIGVAVFAPVTLALIAGPRDAWAPRRVSLGVPLLVATAFLTAGVVQAARWSEERTRSSFERDAASAAQARASDSPTELDENLLLLTISGLAATVLLGTFLLTMTGRTRRIELAVRQRTAALEAEASEREIAEAALRDSEQRFRNILDNVPIGVIYTNLAGDVIQANPRFCELTGYREEELLTLGLTDFMHPDDVAAERQMLDELVGGRITKDRRHKRHLAKDGGTVWVQSTMSLLRDSQNQPWRIVGVVEDITEHLRLEEAEHAREAAEAANHAKSDFLSRMSHELRTPLNAMLGFAQLLELDQRHPLTAAQKPWVVQIQQAGWHLLEMINDVLDLSRIESGTLRLQTDTLQLGELLDATLAMIASDAQARAITISQELAPGTSALVGDATRVKQILTNLLTNAVKYNRDGGRIHVASRILDASSVEIAVTDTGLGMTPRQMAELFQPFNRLGRERTTPQGTGIGLVISQRLAELMGGSLKARSVAGEGSSFLLVLSRALDPTTVPSLLDGLSEEPAEYHRRLVHYIEDNETNVEVMRGILSQRPQVEMAVSIAGLDGLAAVRAQRPDLILLDMHLPDISGMELLRHLKSDTDTAGIPIVIVSADALAQQISDALEAGAERYLTKPVTVNEVLAVLDDLLERVDTAFS